MSRDKTNRIVVYKLNNEVSIDDVDLTNNGYSLEYEDNGKKLFLQTSKESIPKWVEYLEPFLSDGADDITNNSSSFVLFVTHEDDTFAVAGGYGYTALRGLFEEEFGLNVALRMINESEITSINQRSMKGVTRQLFRAVAGYDPLFDRENYNRILKYVEGKGSFEGRPFRVSGRSSLVLRTTKDVENIGEVIDKIKEILEKDEKVHFPRSYKLVSNLDTISRLNNKLYDEFKQFWENDGSRDNLYLEFNEPLAQFRCESYKIVYNRKRVNIEEFDLDIIKNEFKEKGVDVIDSIECLSKFRVSGQNESGYMEINNEKFIEMLVYEASVDNKSYIKFGKDWYEILDEIKEHIDHQLSLLKVDDTLLPKWDSGDFPREKEYNTFVATSKGWTCLDQDFIYVEGRSKIEFCDLYDPNEKYLYHVKKTWGCKSSYLYTQAATAAESFRQSREFREKCSEKWPDLFSDELKEGTIVIAIAADKSNFDNFPLNMTYFAKLNMYNAVSHIKQNDFNVILAPIELT